MLFILINCHCKYQRTLKHLLFQLWVGPGSRAAEEKQFFDSHLAPFYRIEQVLCYTTHLLWFFVNLFSFVLWFCLSLFHNSLLEEVAMTTFHVCIVFPLVLLFICWVILFFLLECCKSNIFHIFLVPCWICRMLEEIQREFFSLISICTKSHIYTIILSTKK